MTINAGVLIKFIMSAKRLSLQTLTQSRPFDCEADATGLYIKNSQGNSRRIAKGDLEAFCIEYTKTGARTAGHYQAQTFNSSYLLAIVNAYETYQKSIAKE